MKRPGRPTIGMLVGFQVYEGFSPNPFVAALVKGARSAARARGVSLLVACGIGRGTSPAQDASPPPDREIRPAWPEGSGGSDFVPVGPWNTDGLMVVGPLRSAHRAEYLTKLGGEGFPVLFIGNTDLGPCIAADNEGGIRSCLDHLVEHGHRRIAFIAGDVDDPGDSAMRLDAYRAGLEAHGLIAEPRLVAYGSHWQGGGYAAMNTILDTGLPFTAVMCSNDLSAIGAVGALRQRGLRIPWDVAVTGFDDHAFAAAQVPPLASVHYPLEEVGEKGIRMLADRIADPATILPPLTRIGTRLVPRHTCGCLNPPVESEPRPSAFAPFRHAPPVSDAPAALPVSDHELAVALYQRLKDGMERSLRQRSPAPFESALLEVVQGIEEAEEDAHLWQSAVSALAGPGAGRGGRRALAMDLLHRSRISLSESASRRGVRLLFQNAGRIEALGRLAALLLASRDEAEVLRVLRQRLEGTGIRDCHVLLYEPSETGDPTASSVRRCTEPETVDLRFPSRGFPPVGMYPEGERLDLCLLPLFHQQTPLGYVAFDAHDLDPLATVVRLLSAALITTRLHTEVLSLSLTDALTGIPNRRYFELIMQKEVERSQRYNRDLAVIMIDIDHFKPYNDDFGHPAGDEALKVVARSIDEATRRELDVVTRYGGEEFAIILPETSAQGARVVAECVRARVAASGPVRRPITISLGVASLRGSAVTVAELVDRADRALYRAKGNGRDRFEVDQEPC